MVPPFAQVDPLVPKVTMPVPVAETVPLLVNIAPAPEPRVRVPALAVMVAPELFVTKSVPPLPTARDPPVSESEPAFVKTKPV